jgi:hypothetical protein
MDFVLACQEQNVVMIQYFLLLRYFLEWNILFPIKF